MACVITNPLFRGKYVPAGKAPVALVADSNVALGSLVSGSTIDGVSVPVGARVLLTGQTAAAENGIYDVFAGGCARAQDLVVGEDGCGTFIYVALGTAYAATIWVCGSYGAVVGTDPLVFRRIGRPNLVSSPLWTGIVTTASGSFVNGKYYPYIAEGYRTEMSMLFDYSGSGLDVQVVNVTTNTTIASVSGLSGGGMYRLPIPIPTANARLLFQVRGPSVTIYSALLEFSEV